MRLRSIGIIVLVGFVVLAYCLSGRAAEPDKPLKAGIIGLDTSHAIAFTKILNDPKATGELADVQVVAGYPGGSPDLPASADRVEKYTEQLRGMGIEICESIDELLGKVDVVLLESVDGRPHLQQAKPVIAAGKPLFIDKPLAGSLADAIEIFRLAGEAKVPCFSSSSLRFSSGFQAARRGESFGQVKSCTAFSPMSIEPHHPDLFWYGIHGVEILFTIMGPGCETVTRVDQNKVVGVWKDGRKGTFIGKSGYGATVEGTKGSGEAGKYGGYQPLLVEIARFFRTGKPPVSAEETLEIYAFMEAADESKRQGGATVTIESVMNKARKAAASDQTVLELHDDGRLLFDGKAVTLEELAQRVAAARKERPNMSVLIQADRHTKIGRVQAAIGACQRAGVEKFSLRARDSEE